MITITRNLARQLRAVFRRGGIKAVGGHGPRMYFLAGPDGLRIRAAGLDATVEYHQPGELAHEEFSIPMEFVELCQSRRDDPITLEVRPKSKVLASWMDASVPQMHEFDGKAPAGVKSFPEAPPEFSPIGPELWPALRNARESTDPLSSRFALGCIQPRGATGEVVATDGGQIFQHGGFRFPWTEELLIPGVPLLGCSELADETDVAVGRTKDCVAFRWGPWTVLLRIETEGRFPKMEDVVAQGQMGQSKVWFGAADARFLTQALPKLPRDDAHSDAITLDLNGQVMVRAKPACESPPTELVLAHSRFLGNPIAICMNRTFLARAMAMGFTEMTVSEPTQPVLCADDRRQHLWAVLDPSGIVPPATNAIRIESPPDVGSAASTHHRMRGKTTIMSETTSTPETYGSAAANGASSANGHAATNGHAGAKSQTRRVGGRKPGTKTPGTPIEQAIALKGALRETLLQTNELIRTLKRQKKQSRLVATTLQSLKQLQAAG